MAPPQGPAQDAGTRLAALKDGLAQADQAERAGDLAAAEKILRGLAQSFPAVPDVLNLLALVLKDRGNLSEAELIMRRALAVAPREAALQNNLGNILRKGGKAAGAERAYRAAIQLRPEYAQAYYNLGVVLHEQGRIDEALNALKNAATRDPAHTDALTLLGSLMGERGEAAYSLQALDAAVASNPMHFGAHYYRGVVLTSLDRFDEAIAMLQHAATLQPGSYEVHYALGTALSRANRVEEALAAYERALEIAPDDLAAHYAYSSLAYMAGRPDLDRTSYAKARARIGDRPDLLLAEGQQLLHQRDGQAAEPLLRRAHEMAPERADVTNALARALTLQKRFGDSAELLADAVRQEPANVQHRRELGSTLLQDHQLDTARDVLEEALAMAPLDQMTSACLSLAYRELGDSRFDQLVDIGKYVRVFDLDPPPGYTDLASFHQVLMEDLASLHTLKAEPFDQTLRGGTQTMGHLFSRRMRAIQPLYERLAETVSRYIRELPDDPSRTFLSRKQSEFTCSGAWSARLRSSGYHANHIHPEGWISSAYYVSLPDAIDDEAGHQGWLKFGESNLGLSARDIPVHLVKPKVGRLVLFPSYFWHGTVPFTADDVRLSVAFDVIPGRQESIKLQSKIY